ncbi:MAG TPA: hypothetical protein VIF81_05640 [Pyrinomonadaceae bacterium]|jgi:hypothetical protein
MWERAGNANPTMFDPQNLSGALEHSKSKTDKAFNLIIESRKAGGLPEKHRPVL